MRNNSLYRIVYQLFFVNNRQDKMYAKYLCGFVAQF